jgi:hypothetical protein
MAMSDLSREHVRETIRWAREKLYVAGRNDCLKAFRRGDYRTLQEALETIRGEPAPVTEEDIDRMIAWREGGAA